MTKPLQWADYDTRHAIMVAVHKAFPVKDLLSLDPRSMLDRNHLRRKLDAMNTWEPEDEGRANALRRMEEEGEPW
jgi:hypothetical protein